MWVAAEGGVVHFPPAKPEEPNPSRSRNSRPKDIDVAGSLLVIADAGNNRIVTMTTAGVEKDIPLLGATSTSQGVAGSPSGQIAFSKSDGSPRGSGLVTPPAAPTAVEMAGDPFGVALGSDGAYWFAMSAANNVQRLTPDGKATPLNGFPPKFFPRQIAPGPNNTLWVTMEVPGANLRSGPNQRPRTAQAPAGGGGAGQVKPTAPETTIAKGPKKKVTTKGRKAPITFRFSSTTSGATFECALVKKPAKKGSKAPKPKFAPCASPKKLKLKPGKYTFSVRAVSAGLTDPTAATSSFRVVHVR